MAPVSRPPALSVACLALALVAGALARAPAARAAPAAPTPAECAAVLERWAVEPKAAIRALVEQCKALAAAAPAAALAPPVPAMDLAALDPCSSPGAAGNLLCWGPWAGLSPAAGSGPPTVAASEVRLPEQRPELAEELTAGLNPDGGGPLPDLPLDSCAPGVACGFATVVTGTTGSDAPAATEFARIELATDGRSFLIRRLDGSLIASVPGMATVYLFRPDDYEGLRASGETAELRSRLLGRIVRGNTGDLRLAADIWSHGSLTGGPVNSGFFAWGIAATPAALDALNAGNVAATFRGAMSGDNATTATLTLNFGSQPAWTGNWVNPAYTFSAGGAIIDADFISLPDRFSANVVASESVVQGSLVGDAGARGVAHLIDVTLAGQGLVRDVGLLREVAPPAGGP